MSDTYRHTVHKTDIYFHKCIIYFVIYHQSAIFKGQSFKSIKFFHLFITV